MTHKASKNAFFVYSSFLKRNSNEMGYSRILKNHVHAVTKRGAKVRTDESFRVHNFCRNTYS